jgi:O-antigen/teichoic acid export membrane protein
VLVLLALRIVTLGVHVLLCELAVPGLLRRVSYSSRLVRPMLEFGGWMTVSNVVGPIMVSMDRFLIGSVLGLAAVAYYVTPYEIITKLLVIPGALVGVLFPMFSANLAGDRPQAAALFSRSVRWLLVALFPVVLVAMVFASDGLRLWLPEEFARNGTAVLQWLAVGVLFNSLAHIPFAFIQGAGRPHLTAKLHLVELAFYLSALWLFMQVWGLVGVAAAWTLRAAIDATALFVMSTWLENDLGRPLKQDALIFALALVVLTLGCWVDGTAMRIVFVTVVTATFVLLAWRHLLSVDERAFVHRKLPWVFGLDTP